MNTEIIWLGSIASLVAGFATGAGAIPVLAVGVSFGSGDVAAGLVIAMAIGLQNMPEGLAVALPLLRDIAKASLYGMRF